MFDEGIKGEGLIGAGGGRFRGAGEDAIEDAHSEKEGATANFVEKDIL